MTMVLFQLAPISEAEPAPIQLWWLWLLVAVGMIGLIAWLLNHLGPGGPWFR